MSRHASLTLLALLMTTALAACNRGAPPGGPQGPGPGAGAPPPPAVGVVEVRSGPVPLVTELPGRVEAVRVAQVRARAAGIVEKRLFDEGAEVRAGQALFRIDPAPLQAQLANASAAVQRAEANLASVRQKEDRYRPLVQTKAVSEQEFADIVAARRLAEAEVAAARATRENARLNLGYASVTAPISGRIGRALVTEGALVGQGEATPLATIQQLDPIYVNLTQSSTDYLRLRQALGQGKVQGAGSAGTGVKLTLENGTPYEQTGRLLFTDVSIDPDTGTVTLRASFPNPRRLLLPGMYVRAQLVQAVDTTAFRVPQQAVTRTGDTATVFVVGPDGKAATKSVKVAGATGTDWVVTEGLADGERVIVDGLQKIGPGAPVNPVPWQPLAAGGTPSAVTAAPGAAAGPGGQDAKGPAGAAGGGAASSGTGAAGGVPPAGDDASGRAGRGASGGTGSGSPGASR